ncbi:MAG: energy transducer TonB [Thermoanaerobaculia bacterium]|nr:energy transducer TonB [Thermoanaerobaculia bacterium]
MDAKKPCVRCERKIDADARLCPFCNQEQVVETFEGKEKDVTRASEPRPQPESSGKGLPSKMRGVLVAVGGLAILVAVFFVGWLVYALSQPDGRNEVPEELRAEPQAEKREDPDLTLIADGSGIPDIERAYTSRLAETIDKDLPEEFQRRDATALPAVVYERVAEEEKRRQQESSKIVDPREVTRTVRYRQRAPAPSEPASEQSATDAEMALGEIPGLEEFSGTTSSDEQGSGPDQDGETETAAAPEPASETRTEAPASTRPVPISQPVPRIVTRASGTIRVLLTIGPDGDVRNVKVLKGLPGITPQIVNAVNRWTFEPATRNGNPVESTYEVEILVKPNR